MFNNLKYKIMKKNVYLVMSTKQEDFLVFGTRKRAEEYIPKFSKEIFDKSKQEDLQVVSRIIF